MWTETRFRRAPWGRKKHLMPLPVLSIVFLVTAMATPSFHSMTVTIVADPNLNFTAAVQNVVHPYDPMGKIVGIMTVTNKASTDIRIMAASAKIRDVTPGASLDTNLTISVPLLVRAGATVTVPFSGQFNGNFATLSTTDSFQINPFIQWVTILPSGVVQGPYTYAQEKTCSGPGPSPSTAYWTSGSCT